MSARLSATFAQSVLGISGLETGTYELFMAKCAKDDGTSDAMSPEDKILWCIAFQLQSVSGRVTVSDRQKLVSTLSRWESEKGANWMMSAQLVKALLGEDTQKDLYPEYKDIFGS